MKTKKAGPGILYAVFLLVICGSWILWFFLAQFTDSEAYENRKMHAMPQLTSVREYLAFPGEFEEFLNDRIPFRNNLVTMNRAIDYYAFGSVRHDRVTDGKDGWLFYSDRNDGDPIACYQGTNLLMDVHLEQIAKNCIKQRDYLAEQGIEFVIFVAPNKERVYWDKMSDKYGLPAETYRALQIVSYLKENTDLRVVYPYEELMAAKEALGEEIYYKTDTHWNYIGGYVGSCALLRELGIEMPEVTSGQIRISYEGERTGDLASNLGLGALLKSAEYAVEGYDTHQAESQGEFKDVYYYRAKDADPRKLYVVRDSFFVSMLPYISSQFNESYARFHTSYKYKDFAAQHPDIFVYETVERYIENLSRFSVR